MLDFYQNGESERYSFPLEDVSGFRKSVIDAYESFINFKSTDASDIPHLCKISTFEYVWLELSGPFDYYREWFLEYCGDIQYSKEKTLVEYEEIEEEMLTYFWEVDDRDFIADIIRIWGDANLVFSISNTFEHFDMNKIDQVKNSPLQSIW